MHGVAFAAFCAPVHPTYVAAGRQRLARQLVDEVDYLEKYRARHRLGAGHPAGEVLRRRLQLMTERRAPAEELGELAEQPRMQTVGHQRTCSTTSVSQCRALSSVGTNPTAAFWEYARSDAFQIAGAARAARRRGERYRPADPARCRDPRHQHAGHERLAVAREIRERRGPLAPLLVAISGSWKTKSDQRVAAELGFDHYLLKPCEPADLVALVDAFARRGRGEASGVEQGQ